MDTINNRWVTPLRITCLTLQVTLWVIVTLCRDDQVSPSAFWYSLLYFRILHVYDGVGRIPLFLLQMTGPHVVHPVNHVHLGERKFPSDTYTQKMGVTKQVSAFSTLMWGFVPMQASWPGFPVWCDWTLGWWRCRASPAGRAVSRNSASTGPWTSQCPSESSHPSHRSFSDSLNHRLGEEQVHRI